MHVYLCLKIIEQEWTLDLNTPNPQGEPNPVQKEMREEVCANTDTKLNKLYKYLYE